MMRRPIVLALMLGASWGCEREEPPDGRTTLVVFAASSLTEAFRDLEEGFEARVPQVDVILTFAGSQVLRLQLEQGARADVFASANQDHMAALESTGLVQSPVPFARNALAVIVPQDNPARIQTLRDIPRAKRLVVGTRMVPVGMYTRKMLKRADAVYGDRFLQQVDEATVSKENNVRLVRTKVELQEADAAIVYRTDAVHSNRVAMIEIPEEINERAVYPIATTTRSTDQAAASSFVDYLLSEEGQRTMEKHGFSPRKNP